MCRTQHVRHVHAQCGTSSCTHGYAAVSSKVVSQHTLLPLSSSVRPLLVVYLHLFNMYTYGTQVSSSSVSGGSSGPRDVLWEHALASLPEPLLRALRDADLGNATTLQNYPRMEGHVLEEMLDWGGAGAGGTASSDAASSSNSCTTYGHEVQAQVLEWGGVNEGGDPKTDQALKRERGAATQKPTMHPLLVSLRTLKVWPIPVLPIGRGGSQPKLRWTFCLSCEFELRKEAFRLCKEQAMGVQAALWTALRNPEHRMKHWLQLVAIPNAPSSSSGSDIQALKKWISDLEKARSRSPRRNSQTQSALHGPAQLALPAPSGPARGSKGGKGGKNQRKRSKCTGKVGRAPKTFEYLMKLPVEFRQNFHERFHKKEICFNSEELVLPWELQVGAHLCRLRRTEASRRVPVSLWQGSLNRYS